MKNDTTYYYPGAASAQEQASFGLGSLLEKLTVIPRAMAKIAGADTRYTVNKSLPKSVVYSRLNLPTE